MTGPAPTGVKSRRYDAHNHLHDDRFGGQQDALVTACAAAGVNHMVVNGSCEEDWPQLLAIANAYPVVLPSFGCHPWYVPGRSAAWEANLVRFLDLAPAAVGEIGLDRWKPDLPYTDQEEVFVVQLRLAAARNLPVSIHCLQAWGRLFDLLRENPRPTCGFLLHSFGGPKEMVEPLARLGAYFSLPGYFAHERKARQRDAFRHVPPDRLLLETDAPDQLLPPERNQHPLAEAATGKPLNHPANLGAVYQFAAEFLGEPLASLETRVEENFLRLFGRLIARLKA